MRFQIGDKVNFHGLACTVVGFGDGKYVLRYDNTQATGEAFESDLSPLGEDESRWEGEGGAWRDEEDDVHRDKPQLPPKLEDTPKADDDFLYEALVELSGIMDYDSRVRFRCDNHCPGCKAEMIEASRIVEDALTRYRAAHTNR